VIFPSITSTGLTGVERRFSIVPLKVYLKGQLVKVEIGVARGKKLHDKRESKKSRDADREMARALRRNLT